MLQDGTALKRGLVILGAAALFTLGLGIVIYVTFARDRITPNRSTPTVLQITATSMPAVATVQPIASPDPTATAEPSASVVGLVRDYEPGALIIVLTPIEGTAEQVIVPENLTVTWADGSRASPREIATGQTLYAEGEMDALDRLIASRIVITELASASATPSPPPTITPAPSDTPWLGWLGEYYGSPDPDGEPLLTRQDAEIDFSWGENAPVDGMPYDGFSVRWRGAWEFGEGSHRFYAFTDDGVRVYVDGELVIDQWRNQAPTLAYGDRYLSAGAHDVKIEYFDGVHNAQIRVWWDFQGAYPNWRGEYYDNTTLTGDPALVRNDADVAFDWDGVSPGEGVPEDNFAVRWTRTIAFDEGAYTFRATADDGVRVWVDGIPLIDEWHENDNETHTAPIWLEQGDHEVRVEYLEMAGDARVRVWWNLLQTFDGWRGAYYANPDLAGRPAWVRDDKQIAFDWGDAGPGHNLPNDNFSVRWSRTIKLTAGTYRFWAYADDGVRVLLDDQLILDQWRDSAAEDIELFLTLEAGEHELVVDYYERGDQAVVRAGYDAVGTVTATPSPTDAATPTPETSPTVAATATPTETAPPPTREVIDTPTATAEPTATSTAEPTATATEEPAATEQPTAEPTPTVEPTSAATPTEQAPAETPTPSPSPEATPQVV